MNSEFALINLEVETEIHFLLNCPLYSALREQMLNFVSGNNAHFQLFTNSENFEFLMSSTDESECCKIRFFLFMSLKEKHNV